MQVVEDRVGLLRSQRRCHLALVASTALPRLDLYEELLLRLGDDGDHLVFWRDGGGHCLPLLRWLECNRDIGPRRCEGDQWADIEACLEEMRDMELTACRGYRKGLVFFLLIDRYNDSRRCSVRGKIPR